MNCHRLENDFENDYELICENFMRVELSLVIVLTIYKNKIGGFVKLQQKNVYIIVTGVSLDTFMANLIIWVFRFNNTHRVFVKL